MTRAATLVEGLARALLEAADSFERGAHWQAAVLWPDPENQFSAVHEHLRQDLEPRGLVLYRLGAYDKETATGPAIWLRCLLDAEIDASPPTGKVPVFLLPGISSAALKHPQTLDKTGRPLAELQYRGEIFRNRRQARDWSVGPSPGSTWRWNTSRRRRPSSARPRPAGVSHRLGWNWWKGIADMDSRIFDLRRQLERARNRVDFCRRRLERFNREADDIEPRTRRIRAKLEADLRLAEQDAAWAEVNLADSTSPAEVAQLRETDECLLAG